MEVDQPVAIYVKVLHEEVALRQPSGQSATRLETTPAAMTLQCNADTRTHKLDAVPAARCRTTCFSAAVAVGMPLVGSPGREPLRTLRSLSGGYTDTSAASRSCAPRHTKDLSSG